MHGAKEMDGRGEHQVDVPGDHILHGLGGAAIGHELKAGAGLLLEEDAGHMRWTAWANVPQRGLVGVCPQPRDQFFQVLRRYAFLCEDELRTVRDQRDGFEIIDHVVGERVDRRIEDVRGGRDAERQRVAVGFRAGNPAGSECPVRSGRVIDDDGLAEERLHAFDDDARNHVRWSACAGWHDDRDRPRRIGLRTCGS